MQKKLVLMTQRGLTNLIEQHDTLQRRLLEVTDVLKDGALASNEDAAAMALAERNHLQVQIAQIEATLHRASVLTAPAHDEVELGSTVELASKNGVKNFTLVDTHEADPATNLISPESPLGKALLGHHTGEAVGVDIPLGHIDFKIVAIH
jgi:transcription elongation factor GreA